MNIAYVDSFGKDGDVRLIFNFDMNVSWDKNMIFPNHSMIYGIHGFLIVIEWLLVRSLTCQIRSIYIVYFSKLLVV